MKTNATPFFQCDSQGNKLFAVQAGISSEEALMWASTLLDTAIGLLDDEASNQAYAAQVLARMAKAAIDAVGDANE